MKSLPDAYPLQWPDGWERTKTPRDSRYSRKKTEGKIRTELLTAIRRLGGALPIISSNIEIRLDGLPYANRRLPDDGGVSVYWVRQGRQEVMACDRWKRPWENMRAIYLAIEGLRAMERAGATQIMERAFQAFRLPAGNGSPWREVLGIEPGMAPTVAYVKRIARDKMRFYHPDNQDFGDEEKYKAVEQAQRAALEELSA